MKTKICSKCNQEKTIDQYYKDRSNKDGLRHECNICTKILSKKYYNPEKKKLYKKLHKKEISKQGKEYYQKNKGKILKKCQNYYRTHKKQKQKYNKSRRKILRYYFQNKYKNDINYRLSMRIRNRIRMILKRNSKSFSTIKLLGCSIKFLKKYLEQKFKSGMSWKNYGKWHIDHIKPCALFDLRKKSEQRKCFHYTNLQPLWASENCSKQDKY